ncbi:MAG: hypothetical protein A2219_01290 [Elusimicrobia bacterium RIFOXYA2_FULL_50_26]|nr:MAG: hypothetical protein A2219_01290 [Elusimicrobia bacterium RIFOXYA2_FULL_50_26]OGS24290.1 MAG: hypothetical protein A2314_07530 [Elusimicrobia bacterium RIFOXYB2_FULL_50_12]
MLLNNFNLTLDGLLRIMFRWQKIAWIVLILSLTVNMYIALSIPLKYESEVIIQRKQVRFSSSVEDKEFDITRLTSEIQRTVTLLKSRFMIEKWNDALKMTSSDPDINEKNISKLRNSLAVKPVNFTDFFVIKVKTPDPRESERKADVLAKVYISWDLDQSRQQAQQMISLLSNRMKLIRKDLSELRGKQKLYKRGEVLNLSGSVAVEEMQASLQAKEKLYDTLTFEMEQAERQLEGDKLRQIHIIATPTVSLKPIIPRSKLILIAIVLSLILMFQSIIFMEWQDPSVRRIGDIYGLSNTDNVITIPRLGKIEYWEKDYAAFFTPVLSSILSTMESKGFCLVHILSPAHGDGKTAIGSLLAKTVALSNKSCCLINLDVKKTVDLSNKILESSGVSYFQMEPDKQEFEKVIGQLRRTYQAVFLDIASHHGGYFCNNHERQADITCLIVKAGKTSRNLLKTSIMRLSSNTNQKLTYILNYYEEPIPKWLRR